MNQEFVRKMLKAKRLEYEAMKEIIPDCLVKHMDLVEEEMKKEIKKHIVSIYNSYMKEGTNEDEEQRKGSRNSIRKKVVVK